MGIFRKYDQQSLKQINTRTLYLSIILGVSFLIPTIYAAILINSLALWTNCWLSIGYITSSIISLIIYKMDYNRKLERFINLTIAMFFLAIIGVIWFNIYVRLQKSPNSHGLPFALSLLLAYVVINSYMFFRTKYYGTIAKSSIMLAQARIYLIKLSLNITIILALVLTDYFSDYPWAQYFDLGCSLILSIFILLQSYNLYIEAKD